MKKTLFVAVFFALFVFVNNASAAATTTPSNGDPMQVGQTWGLNGHSTPIIAAGATVYDEYGVKDTCPIWYVRGCFDITRTAYYRNQMTELAKDLVRTYGVHATSVFPQFTGWINLVR